MRFKFQKPAITKQKKLIQVFPEVCKYSCSKNGEKRNFIMVREFYEFSWGRIKFKVLESVRITCDNCDWTTIFPAIFARKVFKFGVKSHLLINYSKSRIITSRILNIWAGLWRIWLVTIGSLFIIIIIRFYSEPIKLNQPSVVGFQDLYSKNNLGRLITVSGKVDYTLAFTKEVYVDKLNDKLLRTEVYLPLFSVSNPNDFVVIKGGKDDIDKVQSRVAITNTSLLKNQDYTVTGRLETIESLSNSSLVSFFTDELPKARAMTAPQVMVNSADVQNFSDFGKQFLPFLILVAAFLASSIYCQAFIDKKISENK